MYNTTTYTTTWFFSAAPYPALNSFRKDKNISGHQNKQSDNSVLPWIIRETAISIARSASVKLKKWKYYSKVNLLFLSKIEIVDFFLISKYILCKYFKLYWFYLLCMSEEAGTYANGGCGDQRVTCGSWLSPSSLWVPDIKLRLGIFSELSCRISFVNIHNVLK